VRLSTAGGSPIGILTGMKFGQETAMLDQGDTVILYTDGIIEAMNARDEQYGYARFEALIGKSPSDPEGLKSAIVEGVSRFTGLSPQHDDMTMVCFGAVKDR
jgi:sigma-B regulation protein RsbU (phosphoserine phosphatase)